MTRLVPFKVKVLGCDECGAMYGDTENGRRYHAHIPPSADPDGRYDNELVIEQEETTDLVKRPYAWSPMPPFNPNEWVFTNAASWDFAYHYTPIEYSYLGMYMRKRT